VHRQAGPPQTGLRPWGGKGKAGNPYEFGSKASVAVTGRGGWPAGVGKRMNLKITRALVNAALDGRLDGVEFVTEQAFGLSIPLSCPEVPAEILNPRNSWADKEAYDRTAVDLATRFEANFKQFDASEAIRAAGPKAK
jgi:phosphoenolpyruvate carboxykinase (ATP)